METRFESEGARSGERVPTHGCEDAGADKAQGTNAEDRGCIGAERGGGTQGAGVVKLEMDRTVEKKKR